MKSFVSFFLLYSITVSICFAYNEFNNLTPNEQSVLDAFPQVKTRQDLDQLLYGIEFNLLDPFNGKDAKFDTLADVIDACPSLPTPPPSSSVYNLQLGNIKVIMSMGDSISTGSSALDTSVISLREYRGLSFGQGADIGRVTFPNVFKNFTATIIGASTGIGARTIATNGLNGAVSGAKVQDMNEQARWLISALQNRVDVDPVNDWKVVTIWIGSNNLCALCNNATDNSPAVYESNLRSALTTLFQIPRLIVNLLPPLDVTDLAKFTNAGIGCSFVHPIACSCGTSSNANTRRTVQLAVKSYAEVMYKLAGEFNSPRYTDRTVVIQPTLINTKIPERNYLSAADCFHPSALGQQNIAIAFWNNFITPVASKSLEWIPGGGITCPLAGSLIPTCPANNPSCCNKAASDGGYCTL